MGNERQDVARRLQSLLTAWEADVNQEALANGTAGFNRGRGAGPASGRAGGRGAAAPE